MASFAKWIDTLLEEKGIDGEEVLEVEASDGTPNIIPIASLVEVIKSAPAHERAGIKTMLVKIDFVNGNVRDYLKHLAKAIAVPMVGAS
jgi:hypothetical protein